MRITFVIDQLNCGGAEQQLITLCQGLTRRGHDVHVISIYARGIVLREELDAIGVPVWVANRRGRTDLTVLWRLRRLMRATRPDLIHAFLSGAALLTPLLKWMGVETPILLSERSVNDWRSPSRILLENILRERVAGITCNAEAIKTHLIEKEKVSADKIAVIYNGLRPTRRNRPALESIETARERIGAPSGAVVVTCVANFSAIKQHRTLIQAFALAKRSVDHLFLLLIGQGELESDTRMLTATHGVADSTRMIGDCTNPLPFLCASNIAMLTSVIEGCSNALLEAMAMGLPIIASQAGGNGELVQHGYGGYVCPVGDVKAFAQALTRCAGNPHQAALMGQHNLSRIQRCFTDDIMVTQSIEYYEQILAKAGCTPPEQMAMAP